MSFDHPGDGKRCDHCDQPGAPYTYHGQRFSGLTSREGERLCPRCLGFAGEADDPQGLTAVAREAAKTEPLLRASRGV